MKLTFISGILGLILIIMSAIWLHPSYYWIITAITILAIITIRAYLGEITRKSEKTYFSIILFLTIFTIGINLLSHAYKL